MFYGDNRETIRQTYFVAWDKYLNKKPMEPLELQIIDVIKEHPEYHELFEDKEYLEKEYTPEMGQTNPFLHLGMHLAIREQVATNRPQGIQSLYKQLSQKLGSHLEAEHQMMEKLGEAMWAAMRSNSVPDESAYLESCKRLL